MPEIEEDLLNYTNKTIHIPKDIVLKESGNGLLSGLIVSQIGFYGRAYGHKVINRVNDEYVMIYCIDGKGYSDISDKSWVINKGDLLICSKNLCHSYSADDSDPWTILWTHFIGSKVEDFLDLMKLSPDSPVFHVGKQQKITSMFNEIFETLANGYNLGNLLYASTSLQNIFGYLTKVRINSSYHTKKDLDVDKVIEYMLDNLCKSFKLEHFSDYLKMSSFHFSRKFKEKTGYSPIDYFIRLKMQKACELLDNSDMRINEISSSLGYENQYFFSLTFKKVVGYSPRDYRRLQKG